jgi:glycosyltransferase involved in cell wall biosynthesis
MTVKNILFIHQSAELYGSDKVLLLLCSELVKQQKFHPIVVLPESGPLFDLLQASAVEVHIGNVGKISRNIFSPKGILRLIKAVMAGIGDINRIVGPRDIAIVHSNTLAVLVGAVWSFIKRKKHIWHVHEIILKPRLISRLFPRLVNWFSDGVISNSSLTERWLLSEQPGAKDKSVVVFNGLPAMPPQHDDDIRDFRRRMGADENTVVLAMVGRINHWKGQSLLLDAMKLLKDKSRLGNIKLVIVGDPFPGKESLRDELQARVENYHLESAVEFISFLDNVWPVWLGSDIAIVPSTEPEPFGMVAIEAMSAGLPVIAAAHGGLLDIVEDNTTGILFTPCDAGALALAIEKLALSAALRNEMGKAGVVRQALLFSLEAQSSKTTAIYEQVLA